MMSSICKVADSLMVVVSCIYMSTLCESWIVLNYLINITYITKIPSYLPHNSRLCKYNPLSHSHLHLFF